MKNLGIYPQEADFEVVLNNDLFVVIIDLNQGNRSVTNDAENVVRRIDEQVKLADRNLYYIDTMHRIDQLKHNYGQFIGIEPCSAAQAKHLGKLCKEQFNN